jgi:hypothetical protein
MQRKTRFLFAFLAALIATGARPAQSKDFYYFLGYRMIQVIDGDTDAIVATIPVRGWTREAALAPDKKWLYVTTNRHVVNKVSLSENKVVASVDVNGDGWERFIFGFTMGSDDRTAFAALLSRRTEGGEVVIGKPVVAQISLETGKILRSVEVPWGVATLVAVKGGQQVYALGKDLYKIDASARDLRIAETMPMYEKKWNILPLWNYSWENGGVASMNYYTPEIMGLLTIDQASGEITDIPLKGDPVLAYSVIFSPDKKRAYAVMDDLTVIDVVGKTYLQALPLREGTSYGVSVSSDGRKIYVGAGGSSVTIYDAQTLKPRKVLKMGSDAMDLRRVTF